MWIVLLSYLLLVIINAKIDAKEIKNNKPIDHTLEYVVFLIISLWITVGLNIIFKIHLNPIGIGLITIIGSTVTRKAFFDFLLNKFRGLPLTYQSIQTTSLVDKIEHEVEDVMKIQAEMNLEVKDWMISSLFIIIYIILFFINI
jgi:hypothetical protein